MRAWWVILCLLLGAAAQAAEPAAAVHVTRVERLTLAPVTGDFVAPAGRLSRSLPDTGWQTVALPDVSMPRTLGAAACR